MSDSVKKVLFVDDNPQFLEATREIMAQLSAGSWEIHSAQNVGQAMNIIAEKQIDLVVLDVLMPVVDGMQFLSLLNRKNPNVLKAVLTGDASDEHRTICMSRGAELFLAKPQATSEWQLVFESLNTLGRLQPQEGFRGVLRRVGLQDVLQMECLSRNSALLEITTKELRGLIYIFEGQIIHAEAGDRTGTEAFNFLMGLTGGEFAQKPYATPPQQTITDSWEFLLMEAARNRDESSGPDELPAPDINFTIMPQFRPAPAPTPAAPLPAQPVAPPAPQLPAVLPPQWQPQRAPAPAPTPVARPAQWQTPAPPILPQPRRPAPVQADGVTQFFSRPPVYHAVDTQKPEVVEFVIFSSQGDLIYEWQCQDVNARVNFLEFLSQKTRVLGQGLPMGHFERLEVFGSRSRIVTQLENDHAVFVRSTVATDASVVGDSA